MSLGPPHDGVDARDQFVLVERLGHVVVGTEAETFDLVLDAGKPGQDQDRRLDLRDPQAAEDLETRHVGKIQVEEDDVVIVELTQIDPLFAQVGRVHVEALGFEHQFNRLRRGAVVFDQQYAHANPPPGRPGLRSARRTGGA
jgi:hypothetical protein